MKSYRPFVLGLLASLALHLALLTNGQIDWTLPQALPDAPPIEARIESPAPASPRRAPSAKALAQPASPPAQARPSHEDAPQERLSEAAAPAPPAEPEAASAPPVETPPAVPPVPALPAAQQAATAPPVETPPAVPAIAIKFNPLPRRIKIEYRIRYGPASGKQVLLWVREDEHYTLTSVVSATGLAGLFYSGRIAQTSSGRITGQGLVPEEFWDQRGDKRVQARFDYAHSTLLVESAKGVRNLDLPAGIQDSLSLFFQLALTAPTPPEGTNAVFNGKTIRTYRYRLVGEETVETRMGPLRAVHLARVTTAQESRFDIWLAIDRHYLPVRVLRAEESGVEGELLATRFNSSD